MAAAQKKPSSQKKSKQNKTNKRKATPSISEMRQLLLEAILPHVPMDGWSDVALKHAIEDTGLSDTDAFRAYPEGVSEIVDAFSVWVDEEMVKLLDELDLEEMRVRDRIAAGVMARIRIVEDYREVVRHTMAFYALPANSVRGLKRLYETVDLIWNAAGDTSVDFNFYTKRALLAGVFGSTAMAWLDDESGDLEKTEEFLARRLDEVMQVPRVKQQINDQLESLRENFMKMRPLRPSQYDI